MGLGFKVFFRFKASECGGLRFGVLGCRVPFEKGFRHGLGFWGFALCMFLFLLWAQGVQGFGLRASFFRACLSF